ncbi:MAG TPA: PqqD family protein [Acidimicrobiia bacterium]
MKATGVARSGETTPLARRDLAAVTLDGETVIHTHGRVHLLDPVASLVWRLCDGRASVDEITRDLAAAFDVPDPTVREDVVAAVEQLAALGLMAGPPPDRAGAVERSGRLLADPPGSCPSCAERPWVHRAAFRIGNRTVTVGTNSRRADEVLRAALARHLVPMPDQGLMMPPFFALDVHDHPAAVGSQPLHLLTRGADLVARSRRPSRVVRALVAHLATYGDLGPLGLGAVSGLVAGRDGQAIIVEPPGDRFRFGHVAARAGFAVADMPVALVDAGRGEVLVGAPGLDVDATAIDALDEESSERDPVEPLPWGRYRIAALALAPPVSAAAALLALGPVVGDHRDHERAVDALLALVDSVPVADRDDLDALAAGFADRAR